ncbi:MAG TPA: pilus assembly protein PilM [Ignavibacteria bacterium]|nr:pilus assembly protein PilM [Ignavibacteria bacterium]
MVNINLEFSGNILRALQLNDAKEVILKNEITLSFNLNDEFHSRKNKDSLIEEFEESISSIFNNEDQEQKTAGILIGTSQTFLNVMPVDFNEDAGSISSHILWELSNYYPESYKEFTIKYFRLNNNYLSDKIDDVLLIAISNSRLEFIKSLCDSCDVTIKNVEIDHFAVEKCLKEFYPAEIKNKSVLIIGSKSGRLDFSLVSNGLMRYYDYEVTEKSDYRNLLVRQINLLNSSLFNVERFFLYGDDKTASIRNFLEEQFQNIPVSFISHSGKNEDYGFAPLYGLALKNLP